MSNNLVLNNLFQAVEDKEASNINGGDGCKSYRRRRRRRRRYYGGCFHYRRRYYYGCGGRWWD